MASSADVPTICPARSSVSSPVSRSASVTGLPSPLTQ